MKGDFYFGCPNCPEPKTTLQHGEHVFICVASTRLDSTCKVIIKCSVCGSTQDITKKVIQFSYSAIMKILKQMEDKK